MCLWVLETLLLQHKPVLVSYSLTAAFQRFVLLVLFLNSYESYPNVQPGILPYSAMAPSPSVTFGHGLANLCKLWPSSLSNFGTTLLCLGLHGACSFIHYFLLLYSLTPLSLHSLHAAYLPRFKWFPEGTSTFIPGRSWTSCRSLPCNRPFNLQSRLPSTCLWSRRSPMSLLHWSLKVTRTHCVLLQAWFLRFQKVCMWLLFKPLFSRTLIQQPACFTCMSLYAPYAVFWGGLLDNVNDIPWSIASSSSFLVS